MKIESASAARAALAAFAAQKTVPGSGAAGVASTDEAAVVSLSKSLNVPKLENHISDYRRGRGYLSADVGASLRKQNLQNAASLTPTDGLLYATTSSLGGYGNYARLVDSVGRSSDAQRAIAAAPANAEAATARIKKIFGYEG